VGVRFGPHHLEIMPPDTNRRHSSFGGQRVRLGGRKAALPTCRDEVLSALVSLSERAGTRGAEQIFTVRHVHAEVVANGTKCAQVTVFKTMQRMKEEPVRPQYGRLERVGRKGFQLATG
jgi:hypothetical protein